MVCVTPNTVSTYIKKSTVGQAELIQSRDVREGLAAKNQEIGFGLIPCFVLTFALILFSFNYNLEIKWGGADSAPPQPNQG